MLDRPAPFASDRVIEIVDRFPASRSIARPFSAGEDLQEAGLTSLDMVDLMPTLEAAFDLTIPGADSIPADFRSIAAIEALISTLPGRT